VYSEISAPGFEEYDGAYNVFFIGENPPLDNSKAYGNQLSLNTARNIAFVKVSQDQKTILSEGPVETGGYYTFNEKWKTQEHRGIEWLTEYQDTESNASRLKQFMLAPNKHFLIWEVWNMEMYKYTAWAIADTTGSEAKLGPIR
jgi:hypothetical protein